MPGRGCPLTTRLGDQSQAVDRLSQPVAVAQRLLNGGGSRVELGCRYQLPARPGHRTAVVQQRSLGFPIARRASDVQRFRESLIGRGELALAVQGQAQAIQDAGARGRAWQLLGQRQRFVIQIGNLRQWPVEPAQHVGQAVDAATCPRTEPAARCRASER